MANSHEPGDYQCPSVGSSPGILDPTGVVQRDDLTATLSSKRWFPRNPGHVLVVPNEHVENVYVISEALLSAVYMQARRVAIAVKKSIGAMERRCVSTTSRHQAISSTYTSFRDTAGTIFT